ncbi:MAG: hypothetical protein Q7U14_03815 [Lacisediminimonas sp.]|nr:hypothetical protein [Lacisediminimonas sp.]
MKFKPLLTMLAACVLSLGAQAGTIYLCKAYSGGTFWAKSQCSQHSALIERIASVPDSLPFDQQVALAEQQRNAATQANNANTTTNTITYSQPGADRQAQCKALDAQIQRYDAMARQPQTGQTQDWISAQRKTARDRQFQLRC